MIAVPREVISIQSPWRQTPGYIVEVRLAQALAVGVVPEARRGIDGSGCVMTSSPTSPTTGRPCSSNACTSQPSERACSSPS